MRVHGGRADPRNHTTCRRGAHLARRRVVPSFRLGLFFGLTALASVGCMSPRAPDSGERAEKRWDDLQARAALNLRYETCASGESFGANCGFLMERATTEDFRTSFVEKRCEGVDQSTCQARFDR